MKKTIIILLFCFISLSLPVFSQTDEVSKPLEIGITFDWISKTQLQRDENIEQIQNVLFGDDVVSKYNKKEFRAQNSEFAKDNNFLKDYEEISAGKKEDADKYYCGFYWNKLLVAYGIQYKKNMKSIYYYDAMGNLRWVDAFSANYPKFPYYSYQYKTSGELVAAYYYVSDFDQYVYNPDKKFQGRWYKENLYNKKAKIIMTRSNW